MPRHVSWAAALGLTLSLVLACGGGHTAPESPTAVCESFYDAVRVGERQAARGFVHPDSPWYQLEPGPSSEVHRRNAAIAGALRAYADTVICRDTAWVIHTVGPATKDGASARVLALRALDDGVSGTGWKLFEEVRWGPLSYVRQWTEATRRLVSPDPIDLPRASEAIVLDPLVYRADVVVHVMQHGATYVDGRLDLSIRGAAAQSEQDRVTAGEVEITSSDGPVPRWAALGADRRTPWTSIEPVLRQMSDCLGNPVNIYILASTEHGVPEDSSRLRTRRPGLWLQLAAPRPIEVSARGHGDESPGGELRVRLESTPATDEGHGFAQLHAGGASCRIPRAGPELHQHPALQPPPGNPGEAAQVVLRSAWEELGQPTRVVLIIQIDSPDDVLWGEIVAILDAAYVLPDTELKVSFTSR